MADNRDTRPLPRASAAKVGAARRGDASGGKREQVPGVLSSAVLDELRQLVESGRGRDALERIEEALNRFGDSAQLRALRCEALVKLGRAQQALTELEELRKRFPGDRRSTELLRQILGNVREDDDTTTSMPIIGQNLPSTLFAEDEVTAVVEPADVPALLERARLSSGHAYVDEAPTIHEIPTNPHGRVVDASKPGRSTSSQVPTVDVPMLEDIGDSTMPDQLGASYRLMNVPAEDPELSEPTFQMNTRAIEEKMRLDESLGTFHEISSDVIESAAALAGQSARPELGPNTGVESFLAKVIGVTPAQPVKARPKSVSLAVARNESGEVALKQAGPKPPGPTQRNVQPQTRPSLAQAAAPLAQRPALQVASPGQTEPMGGAPVRGVAAPALPANASVPRHQAISPWHSTPHFAVAEGAPARPSIAVDRGASEEHPTTSISYQEAHAKMLQQAAKQSQLSAKRTAQRVGRVGAFLSSTATPSPALDFWFRLSKRSFAIAGVMYLFFLLFWFPFVWESKLARRMDEGLQAGRSAWHRGSASDFRQAEQVFETIAAMKGSRSSLVDSSLAFFLEDVLGRSQLSSRRASAELELLYSKSYLLANYQLGDATQLEEQLSAAVQDVPLVLMATANLHRSRSQAQLAFAAIESLLDSAWPSARLYELLARIRMEQSDFDAASSACRQALSLQSDSTLFAMVLAQSYETSKPGDALKLYDEVLRASSEHAAAALGRAHVVSLLGGQAERDLEALLAQPERLLPGQKAKALEDLARIAFADGRSDAAERHLQAALTETPNNGRLHAELVALYLDQGQISKAEARLRQAIELAPNDPLVLVRQAEWLARAGELSLAMGILDEQAKTHLPSALAKAMLAMQMHDLELARSSLAAVRGRSSVGAEHELAEVLSDLLSPQSQTAQRMWSRVSPRMTSMRTNSRLAVAWALTVANIQGGEARALFREVLTRIPTEPSALAGDCSLSTGDDAFRRCGQALALAGEHPAVGLAAGLVYLQRERFADAWSALSKVVQSHSSLLILRSTVQTGLMLYKVAEVRGLLERWLQEHGPSGEHYFWAGRLALLEGDTSSARSLLARAMESTDAVDAWRPWYAEALFEGGELAAAKQAVRGLSSVSVVRGHAALLLSTIALREKSFLGARDHATDAFEKMRIDGGSQRLRSRAQVALALAEVELGQLELARLRLDASLKTDARNIESYYQLGILERASRRPVAARAAFEKALELYPEHKPSRDALDALR